MYGVCFVDPAPDRYSASSVIVYEISYNIELRCNDTLL